MKWAKRAGIGVLVMLGLFVVLLLVFQRDLLFPRQMVRMPAEVDVPGRQVLQLDNEVEAWFLPAPEASPENPSPLLILAHGNAQVIDHWGNKLAPYRNRGMSVLLVEYRGYGRSPGSPSEDGIIADFVEAYDLVTTFPQVDPERVVLHGQSLGGGVVCGLVEQRPVAAVVLHSTFSSIPDAAPWWAPGFLSRDPFDNEARIAKYDGPVLILHGRNDTLIPVDHAERLHAAAPNSQLRLFDAGHNDLPVPWKDVHAFLTDNGL